jgi:hypothetical protein
MNSALFASLLMTTLAAAPETPAQRHIAAAEAAAARDPKAAAPRVDLAVALARRARETSDPASYARALDPLRPGR